MLKKQSKTIGKKRCQKTICQKKPQKISQTIWQTKPTTHEKITTFLILIFLNGVYLTDVANLSAL